MIRRDLVPLVIIVLKQMYQAVMIIIILYLQIMELQQTIIEEARRIVMMHLW